MSDQAHVQTKALQSLAESRELSLVIINNPSSDIISNYRTAIDPALMAAKLIPVDQRIVDLANEPVPAWLSRYGTGVSKDEIWHKTTLNADGVRQVFVGDGPWVQDLGPVIEIPPDDPITEDDGVIPPLSDKFHQSVVSDFSPCDVTIAGSVEFQRIPYFTIMSSRVAQAMLFPTSSRHLVKTSDGVLHGVVAYTIDGLSRVIYIKSSNGGETWTQTIVDNNDGRHYVTPSITCDKDDGIHITYSRWDSIVNPTYWIYSGSDVPTGFELVSGSGGIGYHRMLGGGNALYYPDIGYNPDDYNVHYHGFSASGGDCSQCVGGLYFDIGSGRALCNYHHTSWAWDFASAYSTCLPLSKTMRLLRYYGIPPSLPAGIVVPRNVSIPVGYGMTRYSALDGYCVFCSDVVGDVVGAASHDHLYGYNVSGMNTLLGAETYFTTYACAASHSHVGSFSTSSASSNPPMHGVVFGLVSSPMTILPAGSIIMSGGDAISGYTRLSALDSKYLCGAITYSDLGGSLTHNHLDYDGVTVGPSPVVRIYNGESSYAGGSHGHAFHLSFDEFSNLRSRIEPNMQLVSSDVNLSSYGNDVFYRYVTPAGEIGDPVNVSEIGQYFPSIMCVCLADDSDDVHFMWSAQGLNTDRSLPRIAYRKKTSGVFGSRVDLTTSEDGMYYPSMDIDVNGDIHAVWYNDTTQQSVEYRKYTSGAWQSVEVVDNTSYCGIPSNIITDLAGNVYVFYTRYSDLGTRIRDMYLCKRTSTWGTPYNLSPGKASAGYTQYPAQSYLNNKGNVVVTWIGCGYGAHTSVYHPVYRVILPDDTVYPPLDDDAIDLFPDDDNEIIHPSVFWHSYPLLDSVYHNLVVSGFSFIYLYHVRGVSGEIADIKFYSSPDALVGDSGPLGGGGSGDDGEFPGGVSCESTLSQESYTIVTRGYICRSHLNNMSLLDNYLM